MKNYKLNQHVMITVFCFLVTNLIGAWVLWENNYDNDVKDLRRGLAASVNEMDLIVEHARSAATEAVSLSGQPCQHDVQMKIQKISSSIPDVMFISLIKDNMVYCSSIYGATEYEINKGSFKYNNLRIITNNRVKPNDNFDSVLVYLYEENNKNVLVGIHGFYLYHTLKTFNPSNHVIIKVGSTTLNSNGVINSDMGGTPVVNIKSNIFNYEIAGQVNSTFNLRYLMIRNTTPLIFVLLCSVMISWLVFIRLRSLKSIKKLLRDAIYYEQLDTFIQPIFDINNQRLMGGELLMRWNHPELGFVSPDKFIPVAEGSNLIVELSELSINQVIHKIIDKGFRPDEFFVCLNVSSSHFKNDRIVKICKMFMSKLKGYNIKLVLEITERDKILNNELFGMILDQLKKEHVEISIDDFGTGNANLTYITQFNPTYIKVDKSFTKDINSNNDSIKIIKNITNLAHQFSCYVVAEGVETQEQLDILKKLNVDFVQGYLLARPKSINEFIDEQIIH